MAQRNSDPKHPVELHEAMNAVFDAIVECHRVIAASQAKVVAKIAQAARVIGWPDHVVSGVINQIQSIAEMQIKMIDHTMEVWREQIKSWPDLTSAGDWPDAEAFKALSVYPVRFWTGMGEQWQKDWAQKMMSEWAKSSKRNTLPVSAVFRRWRWVLSLDISSTTRKQSTCFGPARFTGWSTQRL
jgi:hypothetical protein